MKRPDISDFERETYDGQDYADWYQDYYQALEKYADYLEAKAGQHEPIVNGDNWIRTEEKLPPNDTQVLVYGFRILEGEKGILGYEKTFVCEAKHFDDGCFVKGVNVEIHAICWQPMPNAPKSH